MATAWPGVTAAWLAVARRKRGVGLGDGGAARQARVILKEPLTGRTRVGVGATIAGSVLVAYACPTALPAPPSASEDDSPVYDHLVSFRCLG